MTPTVTAADEGKAVIDANGEEIGSVDEVTDGTALVTPHSEIDVTVRWALGWTGESGAYPLRTEAVETITNSTIHLRSNL